MSRAMDRWGHPGAKAAKSFLDLRCAKRRGLGIRMLLYHGAYDAAATSNGVAMKNRPTAA